MECQEVGKKRNAKEEPISPNFAIKHFSGLLCFPNHSTLMPQCATYHILEIQLGSLKKQSQKPPKHCPLSQRPTLESDFKISSLQYLVSTITCQAGCWEVGYSDKQEVRGSYPQEAYSTPTVPICSLCDHGKVTWASTTTNVNSLAVSTRGWYKKEDSKSETYVNLLHKGLLKSKCLLNIDVSYHTDTTKHLFYTDH